MPESPPTPGSAPSPAAVVGRDDASDGRGSRRSFATRLNLTAVLVVVGIIDVVLARAVGRLMLPNAALSPGANAAIAAAGRFTTNFAGVLAFFVFATVLVRAMTRGELFPRALRLSLAVVAVVFMTLAASALVVAPLSDRQFLHARTAEAFLALFACVIVWRAPVSRIGKAIVGMFAAPIVLGTLALFSDRVGWAPGRLDPIDLLRGGELFALIAAAASPLLVLRDPDRPPTATLFAPMLALVVATAVVAAVVLKPAFAQSVALHAFRMELPAPSSLSSLLQLALVAVAALGGTLALLLGLVGSPPARLIAYALALMVAGGYQPANVAQILLSITGLFALALGVRRELGADPTR